MRPLQEGRIFCAPPKSETFRHFAKITRRIIFKRLYLQIIRKVIDNHSQLDYIICIMIHCVCNNINTAKVDAAKSCGTTFNCGQCRESINARLAEWRTLNPLLEAAE